jgi:hypothetical protein
MLKQKNIVNGLTIDETTIHSHPVKYAFKLNRAANSIQRKLNTGRLYLAKVYLLIYGDQHELSLSENGITINHSQMMWHVPALSYS